MLQKIEMTVHFNSCLQSIRVWQSNLLLSVKRLTTRASKGCWSFRRDFLEKQEKANFDSRNSYEKTIDTISALRLGGAPVTSSVINAVTKGIVLDNNKTLLAENGGHLSLSNDWTRKLRMVNLILSDLSIFWNHTQDLLVEQLIHFYIF